MSENLSLSITAPTDRGVTRYECEGGKSCISIDGDHGRSVIGPSGLELGPSGWGTPRNGKKLRVVEVLEWWKAASD